MKHILSGALLAFVLLGSLDAARASDLEMHIPPGNYATKFGSESLPDPTGKKHNRKEIAGRVVVAIFSEPTMSQGDSQERWSGLLADNPKTKLPPEVALLLFEDMSQAGPFKNRAMHDMKKEFTPNSRPFLILDQNGKLFKKFGVPRDKTEILIYDKQGRLRDVEENLDDEELALKRIKSIVARLLAE